MLFLSPALDMLSIEHLRRDVHVLFGDISYDIRSAHLSVNNKTKDIYSFFQ